MENEFFNDIPAETYNRIHAGTSHDPEKRGEQERSGYCSYLTESKILITEIDPSAWPDFKQRWKKKYLEWAYTRSSCLSTMITGPANFPVHRNNKRFESERNKANKLWSFREWYIKKLKKQAKQDLTRNDELVAMRDKLAKAVSHQEMMKSCNKVVKSKKLSEIEKIEQLSSILGSEKLAISLMEPDFCGRIGFASYNLTNNNANIKRMQGRVVELEKKAQAVENGNSEVTIFEMNGISVVKNAEADRIQILFPDKPELETRALLKSYSFRWSPRYGAWQRKLTQNAVYCTKKFLKELLKMEIDF